MADVVALRPALDIKAVAHQAGGLESEIRRAGQRMEAAYADGRRDLARVWMDCMYGLIRSRNAASGGPDISVRG